MSNFVEIKYNENSVFINKEAILEVFVEGEVLVVVLQGEKLRVTYTAKSELVNDLEKLISPEKPKSLVKSFVDVFMAVLGLGLFVTGAICKEPSVIITGIGIYLIHRQDVKEVLK